MTINHHRVEKLLSAYLDGELAPAEAEAVQEHLLDCAGCREAYDSLRSAKEALGQLPVAEPPAEFWRRIREPRGGPRSFGVPWRRGGGGRRLVGALAAGVLVLVLVLAVLPLVKGTVDRLHATDIGVDLYVREHALGMSTGPLTDRAYLGIVTGDADLVLVGEPPRAGEETR
jgi:anti-sigma factor RsiW